VVKSLEGFLGLRFPVETVVDLVIPKTIIDPTNRLIVRIFANNLDNQNYDLNFYTEGVSNYSFVIKYIESSSDKIKSLTKGGT
jgi:hypothetical protein